MLDIKILHGLSKVGLEGWIVCELQTAALG